MAGLKSRLDLSRASVLVVEDSPQAMEVLSQILMGFGVKNATKCISFREADPMLVSKRFDLVIADDGSFSEAGVEMVRRTRSDPAGVNYTAPIVVLGASASETRVAKVRDAGANFIIVKPVAPSILLDRIEWIARDTRSFVTSDTYRGPDRRFRSGVAPDGGAERRADALRLLAAPDRAMGQDEIDSLFA